MERVLLINKSCQFRRIFPFQVNPQFRIYYVDRVWHSISNAAK